MLLVLALGSWGCTAPLTEMDVRLATQTVDQDFGTTMGTLPAIPCSAQEDLCASVPVPDARLTVSCDTTRMQCVGAVAVVVLYVVDLSKDPAFQSGIGQQTADSVRRITLSYGVSDSLTFAIPETSVHVGPTGIRSPTDPGVVPVGQIGPFPAGKDVPDGSQQLVIEEGTPAFDLLVGRIAHPETPFAFLLATTVPLHAGDPFPAGKLEVRLTPILKLLKR